MEKKRKIGRIKKRTGAIILFLKEVISCGTEYKYSFMHIIYSGRVSIMYTVHSQINSN